MPIAFRCRRCGWYSPCKTRSFANEVAITHFFKSHKRAPFPIPDEMEKVTVSNPIAASDDYTIHLLKRKEFEEIKEVSKIPDFWKALRSNPF